MTVAWVARFWAGDVGNLKSCCARLYTHIALELIIAIQLSAIGYYGVKHRIRGLRKTCVVDFSLSIARTG
jgi:hypothetical protein